MNWYGLFNKLKFKRNKILAVSLSFLGIAALLACYGIWAFQYGIGNLFSNFNAVMNFIFYLLIFGLIFGCNVRNDNFAYQGILMFVFFNAVDALFFVIQNSGLYRQLFTSEISLDSILYSVYALNVLAVLGLGVVLYVFTTKYMRGRIDFGRVRLFGILFAVAIAIDAALTIYIQSRSTGSINTLLPYVFLESSMVLVGGSIVFTLERLRRI